MQVRPKVLFILHYPPPVHGAAMVGQYIKNSQTLNTVFDCAFINLGLSREVAAVGKTGVAKLRTYFQLLYTVYKQLRHFKPDLCYITPSSKGMGLYKDVPVIALAKLFGVKTVFHFHNKGVRQRQHRAFDHKLYQWLFKGSYVILLSNHLYSDIQRYVPQEHVYFCPNGIADESPELTITQKKTDSGTVQLLFLSNLIASKGVSVLLEACAKLKNLGLDFYCTFVGGIGDVTEEAFNRSVAQLDLQDKVHYAGEKYGKEKAKAFLSADIFVHPTLDDCVPLVLLEAMQHQLPVVSTLEGGIPDLVAEGRTGFLVPKGDVDALANKLAQLIQSAPLRQAFGAAGRQKYEAKFTLVEFEKNFVDILKTIVDS